MSAYTGSSSYNSSEDAAQAFLNDQLSKNKYSSSSEYTTEGFDPNSYTEEQMSNLTAFGGPKKFGTKSVDVVTNQDEIDSFNNDSSPLTATSSWDGKNYSQNSMNADDLKDHFGLQSGSDVGSGFNSASGATDSDKTKGNALLGDGYLTDDNFEELRNSDKVWDAYAAIEGQEAADKKREGNPDGLSINALDGLFDNLTANADPSKAPEPITEKEDIVHSPEIQQAKERVGKYENDILSGKTSQQIYGGADKFYEKYKLDLSNNSQFRNNSNSYNFETDTAAYTGGGPVDPSSNYIAFNGSDISAKPTNNKQEQATSSFLQDQKKKTLKQYNFQPVS